MPFFGFFIAITGVIKPTTEIGSGANGSKD
jgi:hypothetical protein